MNKQNIILMPLLLCGIGLSAQAQTVQAPVQEQTISVGFQHSCAVYNGAAWCWGDRAFGRLGDGLTTGNSSIRVAVDGLDSGVTAISVSKMHSCAIHNEAVKCWGDNTYDQIGDNTSTPRMTPAEVSGLNRGVTAISATLYSHTCAIKDGAGQCWGQNEADRLGRTGDTSISGEVSGLNDGVTAISAGNRHGCAVHNGAAKCWGFNGSGQLGDGSTASTPTPGLVTGLDGLDGRDITAITAGGQHSCAVVGATARCWGRGSEGQLGDGTNMQRLVSVEVKGLDSGVTAIAAGWLHTCAIVNAAAKCWGFNNNGQLGNDSQVQSSVAVSVEGLDDGVTVIAVGGSPAAQGFGHSCAIHYGFIRCWGNNSSGQLGDGSQTNTNVPVDVQGPNPLTAPSELMADETTTESITISWTAPRLAGNIPITTYTITWGVDLANLDNLMTADVPGSMTSYVITQGLSAGTLYQIAVTAMNPGGPPGPRSTILTGMTQAVLPGAPSGLNSNAVTANSIVISWDRPETGGADITIMEYIVYWREVDSTNGNMFKTRRVSGSIRSHVIGGLKTETDYQIAVAAVNSAGLTGPRSDDDLFCVATIHVAEPFGAFNTFNCVNRTSFLRPPRDLTFESATTNSIAVSWEHPSSGIADITTYIVYWTAFGRTLESSRTVNVATTSYVITGLDVKTRYRITVAAVNLAGPGERSIPLEERTLGLAGMEAQAIAAGTSHSCVVYNDAAWCWGSNSSGQLGHGNLGIDEPIPDLVSSLSSGVTAISAGGGHSCAIQDAAAKCWGWGLLGQLGNGSTVTSSVPVTVETVGGLQLLGVTAISAGISHSCAVVNGAAKCWGSGGSGELGNGNTVTSLVAVSVRDLDNGVTAIATGNVYSCAIHRDAAKCWGFGRNGELGNRSTANSSVPVNVLNLDRDVKAIAAGDSTACAVQRGVVWCWGSGRNGELGNGSTAHSTVPVEVEGGLGLASSVTMITVGGSHSCAVEGGAAWCWGSNRYGELGSDSVEVQSSIPVSVQGLDSGVTAIAAGENPLQGHTCAIQYDVTKCWGIDHSRRPNTSTEGFTTTPLQVTVTGLSFAAPSHLWLGPVTLNSIVVGWIPLVLATGVPAITSYQISWGTDLDDEEGLRTTSVPVSATSYTISGLSAETNYQIAVAGVNRIGIGNRITLTGRTDMVTRPSVPENLRSVGATTKTITINWERPSDDGNSQITTYAVSWFSVSDPDKTGHARITGEPLRTSYVIRAIDGENLLPETHYRVEVRAVNSAGPGPAAIRNLRTGSLAIILRIQVLLEGALQ